MDFGGVDESLMKSGASIQWFDLTKTSWWAINLEGAKYDGSTISDSSSITGILDTGTSLIAIPVTDYRNLMIKLQKIDGVIMD